MSNTRAARAQARAGRISKLPTVVTQPDNIDAGSAGEERPQLMEQPNNLQKYSDNTYFTDMLVRIGVTRACINQLSTDDFDTMETIVQQYKGSISIFESYLKTINKSMNNNANPVRFSPVIMDRLLATIHHFIQSVTCFHTLPDIEIIDREMAVELIEPYREYKQFSASDPDDEVLIELPTLKGHDNWISYRDKFLSNLDITPGSNGTPLSYIVDGTPRPATRSNQSFIAVEMISLDSWQVYSQSMVHFGPHYRKDNSKVWQLLKRSLLGFQPYHHIDHCAR